MDRLLRNTERMVAIAVGLAAINSLVLFGFSGLARDATKFFRSLPGVNFLVSLVLASEVRGAVKTLSRDSPSGSQSRGTEQGTVIAIPEKAVPASVLIEKMKAMKQQEMAFENGKGFAYTYVSDAQMEDLATCLQAAYESFAEKSGASAKHDDLLANAWRLFMHTNALNPTVYKSLRQFETEIVSMTAWLMHGDSKVAGSLTSGGTESIIMAVKTYRDRAKKLYPNIRRPNIIACITVHPAFEKAVHLLDMEIIHVPMRSDCRMDVTATKKAINRSTILLVGSAPQYCHGVVDPIEEISELALANNLPLHVDACFGGFMLPWLEKLNYKVPLFDFRVPGVTSISADVHKYGYSSKGASIVLYKTAELRSYQYFAYTEWPGGLFGSPSLAGSRPGGMIASAWAAMISMGQDGYLALAKEVKNTTNKILEAVESMDGIKVITQPDMTGLALVSDSSKINIIAVADAMEKRGWVMERQQKPDSIHFSVMPRHAVIVDQLVSDLRLSVDEVKANPQLNKEGSCGMYGMVASIPDNTIVSDFIIEFFSALYKTDSTSIMKQ